VEGVFADGGVSGALKMADRELVRSISRRDRIRNDRFLIEELSGGPVTMRGLKEEAKKQRRFNPNISYLDHTLETLIEAGFVASEVAASRTRGETVYSFTEGGKTFGKVFTDLMR
jgi:DNA-binding HxlR family transcriptional regulator